jgi:hypothetical protein
MSIQLRLDASALAALFPEGTEARVELQRAVIAEFAKQHIKPSMVTYNVQAIVDAAKKTAVADALRDLKLSTGFGSNFELSTQFKRQVHERAAESVNALVRDQVAVSIKAHTVNVQAHVDVQMKGLKASITKMVDGVTDEFINKAVKERFEAALKKI